MNLDSKKIIAWGGVLIAVIGVAALLTSFFLRQGTGSQNTNPTFGNANNSIGTSGTQNGGAGTLPVFASNIASSSRPVIFNISSGPTIAGTLIDTGHPTTTVARFVMGDSGHVLDLPLDVPAATPQIVSNTTIPGIERALWSEGGLGVLVQYLDQGTIKTAHVALSAPAIGTTSAPALSPIHFLPDNIVDVAISPSGASIAYLLRGARGVDGYISKPDGSNAKKMFSLPLTQASLSWPAPGTILAQSKPASGAPGIALSINAKTGRIRPILWGSGLTMTANSSFSFSLYRTDTSAAATLFSENLAAQTSAPVLLPSPLDGPLPEQCVWSALQATMAYCAAPASQLPSDYLDLFHQGSLSIADVLVRINAASGTTTPLATPGSNQGGEASDITLLSLSPSEKYLSFISKDDEQFWGVRLR